MQRQSNDFEQAILLTAVVRDVNDQLDKLYWNLQRYLEAVRKSEGRGIAVAYTALDFAKTSSALLDWMTARYIRAHRRREVQPVFDPTNAMTEMAAKVRWQQPLRAIANCAKHGRFDDSLWPGGEANIVLNVGIAPVEQEVVEWDQEMALEKGWAEWQLTLHSPQTGLALAADAFQANYVDWERLVTDLKL